mmetsp:Transcript_16465/g.36390  ORF Transcript_16465/g.36390 Transcript_16465/m.36390 type:complete len:212 (+) Transcript_16465:136-771(+)
MLFHPRSSRRLGRLWKWDWLPILKDQWFELLIHRIVHHRAVPVPGDVEIQPLLLWVAPCHLTNLLAGDFPIFKASKFVHHFQSIFMAYHVDKSVAKPAGILEVYREVHKVIFGQKALLVQKSHDVISAVVVRQVADHDSHPFRFTLHYWRGFVLGRLDRIGPGPGSLIATLHPIASSSCWVWQHPGVETTTWHPKSQVPFSSHGCHHRCLL